MKILFSPSEGKNKQLKILDKKTNFLESLQLQFDEREAILLAYLESLKSVDDDEICKIFGSKQVDLEDLMLSKNLFASEILHAISLYNGVAYKALDFDSLKKDEQDFIKENVYIFSNLFGAVRADDKIPYYKLNQNYKNKQFGLSAIYKKMAKTLDECLNNETIIDLRAEVYIKAYPVKKEHIAVEFLKNGKKVSHYAKHYRGVFLRCLAQNQGKIEGIESLADMVLRDVKQEGVKKIYTYDVE